MRIFRMITVASLGYAAYRRYKQHRSSTPRTGISRSNLRRPGAL